MLKDNRVLVVAFLSFLMVTLPMTSYVQNEDEGNKSKLDIETTKIDKLSQDFNHEFYANPKI